MALIPSPIRFALAGLAFLGLTASSRAADHPLVDQWLEAQGAIQTMAGEFTQTRTLKTLSRPLTVQGKVWFEHPNQFRWELGDPPHTIAVREPDQVTLVYPRLKRAEIFDMSDGSPGPWRDALALFEAGFPRNRQQLDAKFDILEVTTGDGKVTIRMAPKSPSASRFMPEVQVAFDPMTNKLFSTELHFADESRLRNEFTRLDINPPIDNGLFQPSIDPSFKISRPAKQ